MNQESKEKGIMKAVTKSYCRTNTRNIHKTTKLQNQRTAREKKRTNDQNPQRNIRSNPEKPHLEQSEAQLSFVPKKLGCEREIPYWEDCVGVKMAGSNVDGQGMHGRMQTVL